jgi:sec-independent protein translocase protein TatA
MLVGHLPELILVLVLALIFVGPGKLPELGGALGKGLRSFQRATTETEDADQAPPAPARQLPPRANSAEVVDAAPPDRAAQG